MTSKDAQPARAGGSRRPPPFWDLPPVNDDRPERRTDHARRDRVDQLIRRVRSAQEEIVERGLDAVQVEKASENGAGRTRSGSPGLDDGTP
jgi:hypothetical protein